MTDLRPFFGLGLKCGTSIKADLITTTGRKSAPVIEIISTLFDFQIGLIIFQGR